jgi:hypothetical protein
MTMFGEDFFSPSVQFSVNAQAPKVVVVALASWLLVGASFSDRYATPYSVSEFRAASGVAAELLADMSSFGTWVGYSAKSDPRSLAPDPAVLAPLDGLTLSSRLRHHATTILTAAHAATMSPHRVASLPGGGVATSWRSSAKTSGGGSVRVASIDLYEDGTVLVLTDRLTGKVETADLRLADVAKSLDAVKAFLA